jgi:hypothetical protein
MNRTTVAYAASAVPVGYRPTARASNRSGPGGRSACPLRPTSASGVVAEDGPPCRLRLAIARAGDGAPCCLRLAIARAGRWHETGRAGHRPPPSHADDPRSTEHRSTARPTRAACPHRRPAEGVVLAGARHTPGTRHGTVRRLGNRGRVPGCEGHTRGTPVGCASAFEPKVCLGSTARSRQPRRARRLRQPAAGARFKVRVRTQCPSAPRGPTTWAGEMPVGLSRLEPRGLLGRGLAPRSPAWPAAPLPSAIDGEGRCDVAAVKRIVATGLR